MSSMQTVNPLSIVFMCVTLLICFGVPIGLAIWAKVKYKKAFSFLPLLAGVIGFLLSQVIFRIPMIQLVLPLFGWYKSLMTMTWPYLIFLSFTAGLVEEPARFIAFAIMKKRRQYPDGLSYGIGHGGFEAIITTGMTFVNNIVLSLMINSGSLASLGGMIPQQAVNQLVAASPDAFLMGGIERIFAITFHIALSFVVLRGFQTGRKWQYLLLSILLHGIGNLATIAMASLAGAWAAEGLLLGVAAISLLYIIKQARGWRKGVAQPQVAADTPAAE